MAGSATAWVGGHSVGGLAPHADIIGFVERDRNGVDPEEVGAIRTPPCGWPPLLRGIAPGAAGAELRAVRRRALLTVVCLARREPRATPYWVAAVPASCWPEPPNTPNLGACDTDTVLPLLRGEQLVYPRTATPGVNSSAVILRWCSLIHVVAARLTSASSAPVSPAVLVGHANGAEFPSRPGKVCGTSTIRICNSHSFTVIKALLCQCPTLRSRTC